jgi:hypothetical protein
MVEAEAVVAFELAVEVNEAFTDEDLIFDEVEVAE